MSFAPLVTPPSSPLSLENVDCFVVPIAFGEMAGHGRARTATREGRTLPADIARAETSDAERVFVPLWRVEGASESFHVGLSSASRPSGRSMVLPTGGFRHQDRTVLVLARRHFGIDPSGKTKLELADARAIADLPIDDREKVLPDVSRAEADAEATDRLRRRSRLDGRRRSVGRRRRRAREDANGVEHRDR